jgi:hypothetical protein
MAALLVGATLGHAAALYTFSNTGTNPVEILFAGGVQTHIIPSGLDLIEFDRGLRGDDRSKCEKDDSQSVHEGSVPPDARLRHSFGTERQIYRVEIAGRVTKCSGRKPRRQPLRGGSGVGRLDLV